LFAAYSLDPARRIDSGPRRFVRAESGVIVGR
jgi:hypothetical protein